ncbi:MAG: hypothetical protein GX027_00495 [Clostridiaceae bacterium]|nr:hypothetical protein [Clostridiaceae bacterium]
MDNSRSTEPISILSIVPGRNVILSDASGVWTVEAVEQNKKDILELVRKFGGKPWAFLGDVAKMAPIVDAEVSKAFSSMHPMFESNGAVACAFVVGSAIAIKVQAQRHHDTSGAQKLKIGHFRTREEALDWLATIGV